MCAKPAFPNPDSHSRRLHVQRFSRFARNAGHMDMKDVKVALDIIIRPSLQLWTLAPGRSVLTVFKRPKKTALLCDNTSSTSSLTPKVLRYHGLKGSHETDLLSRKRFALTRNLSQSRARVSLKDAEGIPALLLHALVSLSVYVSPSPFRYSSFNQLQESCDAYTKSPEPALETDASSIYEDCLSDHPDFLVDLQALEGGEHVGTRPKGIRKSEFYEMESGIAMFDRAGYASYCLSRWLDKQREDTRAQQERVFDGPALVSWPRRALSLAPPTSSPPDGARPMPPLALAPPAPVRVCQQPRSLPWRTCKYIEDELQNAMVIIFIGLFIHICLFLFLVYDILKRGFAPSDD